MMHLGLTGFPLAHSLSPKLQNAALQAAGLEGEYSLYPALPSHPQELGDLLGCIRSGELTGLNITLPYKQAVIPLLDGLSPAARAIGAVNLITMHNGALTGCNTDAPGFLTDLNIFLAANCKFHLRKKALILGAGGSARAVVHALVNQGWQGLLAARSVERAQTLINSIKLDRDDMFRSIPLNARGLLPHLGDFSLVVNTTPVGMFPKVGFSPWPPALAFPEIAAIYDLVYNPPETLLVKQAHQAGLPAATGLGMLVEQARLSFEIWTGRSVSRNVMLVALEEK
jgi:shikimate dehydrogenase